MFAPVTPTSLAMYAAERQPSAVIAASKSAEVFVRVLIQKPNLFMCSYYINLEPKNALKDSFKPQYVAHKQHFPICIKLSSIEVSVSSSVERYIKELKKRVEPKVRQASKASGVADYMNGMTRQRRLEAELERLATAYVKQLEVQRKKERKKR